MKRNVSLISMSVGVLILVTLAGCTTPETPQVASASPPAAASSTVTATSAPAKETDYDKALRYTRCMTENGVPMSDPVEGKELPIANKPDANTPGEGAWKPIDLTAFHKCKQLLPTTWPVKWDPQEVARTRPYFECMRQLGMDVPKIDPNGLVHDRTDPTAPQSAEYKAAEQKCRSKIPGEGTGGG